MQAQTIRQSIISGGFEDPWNQYSSKLVFLSLSERMYRGADRSFQLVSSPRLVMLDQECGLPSCASVARRAPPFQGQFEGLWAYNLDASDPDDLSFAAGDIITIVEETNADWWLGEHNGCKALFPANYVEKIVVPAPASRTLPLAYVPPTGGRSVPPTPSEKKEYKPFMAAHSNVNAPPPPGAGTNSVGLQQDPGQDGKKSKFGKYGNTMAHSAAGGVGFGAGAAIGGGLVRAIF